MEDARIIEHFWERNEDAIKEAGEKYGSYCHAVAYRVLHDSEDADECVNDTWLRAWNSIPPERPVRLRAFLAKLTRNLAFNRYGEKCAKKRGGGETALVLEELEECVAGSADVEGTVMAGELEKSVNAFVTNLPKREANLFIRRYFFTEPVALIAQRYHLSENYVMVILSRVRRKLKRYLEQEEYVI